MKKVLLAPLYFIGFIFFNLNPHIMQLKTAYNIMCTQMMREYFAKHGTITGFKEPEKPYVTWKKWWAYFGYK